MKLTFNIPDSTKDRVIDALANKYGYETYYQKHVDTDISPMPKEEFVKKHITNYLMLAVVECETNLSVKEMVDNIKKRVLEEVKIT